MPLSHYLSCGIAGYRCYTPTSFFKIDPLQSKDRPNKGGIAEKSLPLKPIAFLGTSLALSAARMAFPFRLRAPPPPR